MAVSGLNPSEIAACVGDIIIKARPHAYIIKAPPGTTSIKIANQPEPSKDKEPSKGAPMNKDNTNVVETPEIAEKTITGRFPYFAIYLPEKTVKTAAPNTPTITNASPFNKLKLSGETLVPIAVTTPTIASITANILAKVGRSILNNVAMMIVARGIVAYNKPPLAAVV